MALEFVNKKFNNWLIIGIHTPSKKIINVKVNCQCSCGKKYVRGLYYIIRGISKKCIRCHITTYNKTDKAIAHFKNIQNERAEKQRLAPGLAMFNELFRSYKYYAKKRGYEFNLTEDEFKFLTENNCYYCNQEPSQVLKNNYNNGDYIYNGIDRANNKMGYNKENCVSCCKTCNISKNALSQEEFIKKIKQIYINITKNKEATNG